MAADGSGGIEGPEWAKVRDHAARPVRLARAAGLHSDRDRDVHLLAQAAALRAPAGDEYRADAEALARELWTATLLLDKLGLLTTELFQKSREEVIARQQREMLELSTPVVALWEGILAVPLIGTLDSERTQVVMENLLQRIVDTGASIAIIDITGVPTVDTLVAQHLLKTVGGGAPDGRGVHHQRHPAPDRPDDRAPGRRPRQRRHQGHARRRARARDGGGSAPP